MQYLSESESSENRYYSAGIYSEPFVWQVVCRLSISCPSGVSFTLEARAWLWEVPREESTVMAPKWDGREGSEPGVAVLSYCAEQKFEEMNSGAGSLVA